MICLKEDTGETIHDLVIGPKVLRCNSKRIAYKGENDQLDIYNF